MAEISFSKEALELLTEEEFDALMKIWITAIKRVLNIQSEQTK